MSRYVDLGERVTAQFYDQEHEEWTMQTVTIEDVLDSVCDEYTVLPSAQPYTDTEIEKMQDLEQAEIDKAYELGREEALSEIVYCSECKYSDERWRNISTKWLPCMSVWMGGYWHCGSGERREE